MKDHTKLDVAIEIMALKVAKVLQENSSQKEINDILKERDEMYSGNMEIIEKIIKIYGPEIKLKED